VRSGSLKLGVEFWQSGEKLGANESVHTDDYDRTDEVLGLVGVEPAKVRVHFVKFRSTDARADQPAKEDSSVEGKTFVADATDGKLVVTTDDGRPVEGAERSAVERAEPDLGKGDPIVSAFGNRPIRVGKSLKMPEPLFRALIGGAEGQFKGGSGTMAATRTGSGKEQAVFEWSAQMKTQEEGGLEVTWQLKGKVTIDVSPALVVENVINASLDASGHTTQNGARVELIGAGSMTDRRTLTIL
jgi:hypothetical protein